LSVYLSTSVEYSASNPYRLFVLLVPIVYQSQSFQRYCRPRLYFLIPLEKFFLQQSRRSDFCHYSDPNQQQSSHLRMSLTHTHNIIHSLLHQIGHHDIPDHMAAFSQFLSIRVSIINSVSVCVFATIMYFPFGLIGNPSIGRLILPVMGS
jgi:hypothetical protein